MVPIGAERAGVVVERVVTALKKKRQATARNKKIGVLVIVVSVAGTDGLHRLALNAARAGCVADLGAAGAVCRTEPRRADYRWADELRALRNGVTANSYRIHE